MKEIVERWIITDNAAGGVYRFVMGTGVIHWREPGWNPFQNKWFQYVKDFK